MKPVVGREKAFRDRTVRSLSTPSGRTKPVDSIRARAYQSSAGTTRRKPGDPTAPIVLASVLEFSPRQPGKSRLVVHVREELHTTAPLTVTARLLLRVPAE